MGWELLEGSRMQSSMKCLETTGSGKRPAQHCQVKLACLQVADLPRSACAVHHSKVSCLLLQNLRILSGSLLRRPLPLQHLCIDLCMRVFFSCILQGLAPLPASPPDYRHASEQHGMRRDTCRHKLLCIRPCLRVCMSSQLQEAGAHETIRAGAACSIPICGEAATKCHSLSEAMPMV